MVTNPRLQGSLSLDLDDLWAYLKTAGDPTWEARPSYLPAFLPRALDLFGEEGIRLTWFCVGADAERVEHQPMLARLAAEGHELGNHSYSHDSWLSQLPAARQEEEIERAQAALTAVTGERPYGFRAPSFSWSATLLETLARMGYRYDASTFPTYLGPLLRTYYFATTPLTPAERVERASLFGGWREGLRPLRPYWWRLPSGQRLLEIPVTTFPMLRTPIHFSYLAYLGARSEALMIGYLRAALRCCRLTGIAPSYLLHPLDILGGDEVPALGRFPGMNLAGADKRRIFRRVIRIIGQHVELVPLGERAGQIAAARLATAPDATLQRDSAPYARPAGLPPQSELVL